MMGFNRVNVSERMKSIVQELQPVRTEVAKILQSCDRITVPDIAQSRLITTGQSIEPRLYGRDHIMNSIIHDMAEGKYRSNDLTVLPIVGPGGIGKTTLIQHIHTNKKVQNYFQVIIWVCVSLSFNLNKLLEEIKTNIPHVEGEKDGRTEELIEQRLKSKRFLLVLDDIWAISNEDEWKRLLLPFKASQEKGSVILLTTRFPEISKMVETTNHIELKGLNFEDHRKLFHAFVFGDEPLRIDHNFLLETGDRIMEKLKGPPLAAKTVGTLLRKDLSLQWESQTDANDIMPALKLSYDYLPFQQKQCFSYSALFPEDHRYIASELINLWIGLDILQPDGRNRTLEDIGRSNLNDLVTHGFFKKDTSYGHLRYVMHDLIHDLAVKVASHEYLTVHHSNVRFVEIYPSIRHLSIITDNDTMFCENFESQIRYMKTRLKVEQLHTLMLFGTIDKNFATILSDFFREANSLRVLHLVKVLYSVEFMLHNFSTRVHLRYLYLNTKFGSKVHLLPTISRFYHLRILDLQSWHSCHDLPKDLSNLANLRHFYTPSDELHSHISNVGQLSLLQELKVFRVNKESHGFELKQLENLTELRELGIYNLEKIHTKEEGAKAKLIEKYFLERLTLEWDSEWSNTEPDAEEVVLESLQPHRYLKELCIKGHKCLCCPMWLGDELTVEVLQSLHLSGVSWEYLPPLGKMWDLRKLQSFCMLRSLVLVGLGSFEKWVPSQDAHHMLPLLEELIIRECPKLLQLPFSNHIIYPAYQYWNIDWLPRLQWLQIEKCLEIMLVPRIPWTETLHHASVSDVKLLKKFDYNPELSYLNITGKDELCSLDQVLAFHKLTGLKALTLENCPSLDLKDLLMLTSLERLNVECLDGVVGLVEGEGDMEWKHPIELLVVKKPRGTNGKELTDLLTHLTRLSELHIIECKNITQLGVQVDVQQTTSATSEVEHEKEEDGMLLFPAYLSALLQDLVIHNCRQLVLVDPLSNFLPGLQWLRITGCPKIRSWFSSPSCFIFPSSLQSLILSDVKGMRTLESLSNLTNLAQLNLRNCGEDLRCKGLGPLLTTRGQLKKLYVYGSRGFFAGWDPNHRQELQDEGEGEMEFQKVHLVSAPSSSTLEELWTDEVVGLLAAPICCFLSSSLTHLRLYGDSGEMEFFTKEQEGAIHLLASLQQLQFWNFGKHQTLPAGLHKLTGLKQLQVWSCPATRSLPKDSLPESLKELDVSACRNEELKQQCSRLVGTIPTIRTGR
ncbi:hypothetical protein VPH35_133702 [Triticum aestivum]